MVNTATTAPIESSSRAKFFNRYDNDVDEYGFNLDAYARVERFFRFLYRDWFGVQIAGLENIPAQGSALLFGNHSGVLPVDGCLLYDGIITIIQTRVESAF